MSEPTVRVEYWESVPPPEHRVILLGFNAYDYTTGTPLYRENLRYGPRKWKQRGVALFEVAGETFHAENLQHPGFVRGSPIGLRVESNEHAPDGIAVAVYESSYSAQAGHIANRDLAVVRKLMREELDDLAAIAWREARYVRGGRRCSLDVLVYRAGALHMNPIPPPPARRGLLQRLLRP